MLKKFSDMGLLGRAFFFFSVLTGYPASLLAQDSVSVPVVDATTKFSGKQLVVPLSLITVGVVVAASEPGKSFNRYVKGEVAEIRTRHIVADDYLQYMPAAFFLGFDLIPGTSNSKHDFYDRAFIMATAYLTEVVLTQTVKHVVHSPRPDNPLETNSFPSGHTATAFVGAELVRREYWDDSPVYGITAYVVATGVGVLRVYNERHWATDVIAGAGFGILSAQIGYWLLPINRRLFRSKDRQLAFIPYYTGQQGGLSLSYQF